MIFFQRISQCFCSSGADGVASQAGARQAEKPRLAKPERDVPTLSQMPPGGTIPGTAEVGHQASSSHLLSGGGFGGWTSSPAQSGEVGSSPAAAMGMVPSGECIHGRSW